MVEQAKLVVAHGMIPGSHERGGGAECRCGGQWDRWNDQCLMEAWKTRQFRDLNFSVTFGENKGYLAVENNFSSVEVSFVEHEAVKNAVTLSIEDLRKLIPALQIMVDGAEKFGKKA
jgi:hypothetical protein